MGLFGRRKTVFADADILVIGGGMAGCGATYESRYWGRNLKIVCVEKANIERSGAVAQACMRSTATWACSGTRTDPKTMSATHAMISWVWCARIWVTISLGMSTPQCTGSRRGAFPA